MAWNKKKIDSITVPESRSPNHGVDRAIDQSTNMYNLYVKLTVENIGGNI